MRREYHGLSPRARSARTSASDAAFGMVDASLVFLPFCFCGGPERRFGRVYVIPLTVANSSSCFMISSSPSW